MTALLSFHRYILTFAEFRCAFKCSMINILNSIISEVHICFIVFWLNYVLFKKLHIASLNLLIKYITELIVLSNVIVVHMNKTTIKCVLIVFNYFCTIYIDINTILLYYKLYIVRLNYK